MKIRIIKPEETGHAAICDEYLCTDIKSLEDLFEVILELKSKYLGHTVLATLDDLSQAQYTSMHAEMSHDLDETDGHDLSSIDSVAFEDGNHVGYLSTKSEFFIRESNFLSKATSINFLDVCRERITIDDHEISILEKIHASPIEYIDDEILLKVVPVQISYLAISAFPNGYFSCDLDPFENYALSKYLEINYGYELFALGASLIGFKRTRSIDDFLFEKLAQDLAKLYNRENDKSVIENFINIIKSFDFLFLKYVEQLNF